MVTNTNSPQGWIVQKFGGTSVGKFPELIVEDVVRTYSQTKNVAVVCSARSTGIKAEGTTSRLLEAADKALKNQDYAEVLDRIRSDHLKVAHDKITDVSLVKQLERDIEAEIKYVENLCQASQIIDEISCKTLDSIVSVGEKLSCLFMTALLTDRGIACQYVDLSAVLSSVYSPGGQLGMGTGTSPINFEFYKNLIQRIVFELQKCQGKIPIITGYFGIVPGGLINRLGRGYTDICAGLVAVGLNADELQIWKEVDGIFTADPRKVPKAQLLNWITPEEASELTYYGSEVIHPTTMELVVKAKIPIRIKNVANAKGHGTIVFPDNDESYSEILINRYRMNQDWVQDDPKSALPTAITTKQNIITLNVKSNKQLLSYGFLSKVFQILNKHGLVVDLISTSKVKISMAIHHNNSNHEHSLRLAVLELKLHGEVDITKNLSIISLIGKNMKKTVGLAGAMLSSLGQSGVNVEMISQGVEEINISCVIDSGKSLLALKDLHARLLESK
ncbi:aspartokinase [Nadsonia fulvescens var. elongata DSM 6958]|uniref:Aspartokinase n=1 Tax=Nadsonia fulvescens var. elongata DSM 6958 TaxID=857566 RepID=A0A1E3PIE6_9ASCO|nr:aspartokinase [Nadsonia fulvescens var. elongata DSM 6958]